MRIWLFLALFTFPLALALNPHEATVRGYANLGVINAPPHITEVQLAPTPLYKDQTLECLTKVQDEQLPSVLLHYTWMVNGKPVPETNYKLSGFTDDDRVQCTVYAEDNVHQVSNTQTLEAQVSPAPWHAQVLSTTLSGVGIPTDIAHAIRLEEQGTPAITGYVIDESGKNGTGALLIVFIGLIFLTLLNVNLVLRHYVKKHTQNH